MDFLNSFYFVIVLNLLYDLSIKYIMIHASRVMLHLNVS